MHPSRTYVALVDTPRLVRFGYIQERGTWKYGLDLDVRRPPSEGAGVGFGPVVVVAALWSKSTKNMLQGHYSHIHALWMTF